MKTRGKVICFVGPSGVGKTSYTKRLIGKYNFGLPTVVTTRQPRSDDDGRYLYVTDPTFIEMVSSDYFLEWDRYSDYYYGTLLRSVEEFANSVHHCGVILDLTPRGCRKVKKLIPTAIVIALLPDDPAWLFERLISRSSQSLEEIQRRTNLLKGYLDEVELLNCTKIYASFSPESWDKTFEAVEKGILELEDLCG